MWRATPSSGSANPSEFYSPLLSSPRDPRNAGTDGFFARFFVSCRLITIYDCKIDLKWAATAADGTEAKGTLTVPEVSHEMPDGLSDYVVRVFLSLSMDHISS